MTQPLDVSHSKSVNDVLRYLHIIDLFRHLHLGVQSDFEGEKRSANGNAAALNPTDCGTIQIVAETAEWSLSKNKSPIYEILAEVQRIPQNSTGNDRS